MKPQIKRPVAILIIMCVAILLGFIINSIWDFVDKKLNPKSYDEIISECAEEFCIPEYIIYATIKVESGFDPDAISSAGARGLMQMMPKTFEWLTGDEHLGEHLDASKLFDPEVSIRYGTYYLRYLYRKFDYNWDCTFAAYNAGEGNVSKWLADENYSDGKGNLTGIPFEETKRYVRKINDAIDTYKKLYYET